MRLLDPIEQMNNLFVCFSQHLLSNYNFPTNFSVIACQLFKSLKITSILLKRVCIKFCGKSDLQNLEMLECTLLKSNIFWLELIVSRSMVNAVVDRLIKTWKCWLKNTYWPSSEVAEDLNIACAYAQDNSANDLSLRYMYCCRTSAKRSQFCANKESNRKIWFKCYQTDYCGKPNGKS